MNTLFTFGCSYTEDFSSNLGQEFLMYKKFRNNSYPKSWPILLSEYLNLDLKNYGESAAGNDIIFHSFCEHLDEFKRGDVIIIEWTYIHRYRWTLPNNNSWVKAGTGYMPKDFISRSTHEEICANRTHPLYVTDIYRYIKIINKLAEAIGFDIYFWSVDDCIIYDLPTDKKNFKYYLLNDTKTGNAFDEILLQSNNGRIKEETNGLINDLHLGESGHKVQADLFFKHIKL
jgi:hypothetical protein